MDKISEINLIEINGVKGFKSPCPKWLKKAYIKAVEHVCQLCHKPETLLDRLEPHRIKQNNMNGLYTIVPLNHPDNNIKVVHHSCHIKLHQNNYSWCQSK